MPLYLRAEARREIDGAFGWYEDRQPGLGDEFLSAVRSSLAAIEGEPRRFPKVRGDVRRAVLRRFPYSLLFIAETDRTVVVACFHGSRDPDAWIARIPP